MQQLRSNKPSFRYRALTPSELNDVLDDAYLLTAKLFPAFTRAMRAAGWLLEQTTLGGGGMVVSFQPKDE